MVPDIPDKLYFKIGEVSKITGLKSHVLRYWETEFPSIRPIKSKSNQRLYQRKDIETILLVKQLLYENKFTINGARRRIKELRGDKDAFERMLQQTDAGEPPRDTMEEAPDRRKMERALLSFREKLAHLLDLLDNKNGA